MLYTRQGDNLVFDIEKIKSIVDGGVNIAPIMFNKELHYFDLQSQLLLLVKNLHQL